MLRTILKLAYSKQKSLARNYARRARNPGVDRRMALLNKDQLHTKLEDLEQLEEADFSQVHKSHKQYEQEAQHYRERLQSWIVGNKYFKTKQLNFLTWSEKEQIRYLHNFDPEEWSIDKLVESFPADRYTIVKIIKAKWIPRDANRVQKHDETVQENWELFKSGRIKNIDGGFAEHLNKFVHRNFQEVQKPKVEHKRLYEIRQQVPEDGEFSRIITSCKKYAQASEQTDVKRIGKMEGAYDEIPEIPAKAPNQDMFVMKDVSDRYPKTLRQVKRELGVSTAAEDSDESDTSSVFSSRDNLIDVKKYESELISFDASNTPSSVHPDIRESIQIPRKLYKKGATYQLDDCFYDDDGEFLYRVPGMTGKSSH
ncbi:uncharacterized protein LOC135708787 [Ochlerotatus camptorhynchus]|uniref:uncharacterized protein LOC135708787 n=1 Tax=Ochlerotatus camptorhynchus TaxID=644619 RepID=UPI0031D54B7E